MSILSEAKGENLGGLVEITCLPTYIYFARYLRFASSPIKLTLVAFEFHIKHFVRFLLE